MNQEKQTKKYLKYIEPSILLVVFFFMIYFMIKSTEQMYQVPRDLFFYRGVLFVFAFIFIVRKIPLKRFAVWGTLVAGCIGEVIYLLVRNILPSTYGKDLFRIKAYKWFFLVLIIALLVDSFIRWKKEGIKEKFNPIMTGILLLACILAGVMDKTTIVPFAFVSIAIISTDIDREKWVRIVDIFAISYYLVFAWFMTLSLIKYADNAEMGRFIGAFLQVETGGMFCSGALLCMIYFVIKFVYSDEKK